MGVPTCPLKTNGFVEAENFQTAIAINSLYLLTTAVNGKIVKFFWLNFVHILKYFWLYTTEPGTICVNSAFSAGMVEINTPSAFAYHTQV
jgi:hypothetical protein